LSVQNVLTREEQKFQYRSKITFWGKKELGGKKVSRIRNVKGNGKKGTPQVIPGGGMTICNED